MPGLDRIERGAQALVDLDQMDARHPLGQTPRQHPFPAPDLEHDVVGVERGVGDDRLEQVGIGEKVLPEPDHGGPTPASQAHQPKSRWALAVTTVSSAV